MLLEDGGDGVEEAVGVGAVDVDDAPVAAELFAVELAGLLGFEGFGELVLELAVGVELFLGGELVGEGEGEEEGVLLGPARLGVGLLVAEEAGEEAHDHTSTGSNATRSSTMRAK